MSFNRLHFIRRVDLFGLRLFLSIVEEQQIGRGAAREHVAPSTATKRLHDLEELVGAPLLERMPHGVRVTPAGMVLSNCVKEILSSLDTLRREIDAFTEGVRGQVVIASSRSIVVPFLARELGDFARDFPKVELVVLELEDAEIIEAVTHGKADIGVFAREPGLDLSGVETFTYRRDKMVTILPRAHPLSERKELTLADLVDQSLIGVGSISGELLDIAHQLNTEVALKYSVRSAGVAISLVQAGLGVTVQPECLLGIELFDQISAVKLTGPGSERHMEIATSADYTLSAAAQALLNQLLGRPPSDDEMAA